MIFPVGTTHAGVHRCVYDAAPVCLKLEAISRGKLSLGNGEIEANPSTLK